MKALPILIKVVACCLLALLALVGYELVYPSSYEVAYPANELKIRMRFTPAHPYLAEYDRSIVFTSRNGTEVVAKLFPDTGGYVRSQLYAGTDGRLYLDGYFDVAVLDPDRASIEVGSFDVPQNSKYLGAFDYVDGLGLKFLSAAESPAKRLVAKGG